MTETQKKIGLVIVIVVALALAIWQGYTFVAGPPLKATKTIGGFSAGHTGKAAQMGRDRGSMDLGGAPQAPSAPAGQ